MASSRSLAADLLRSLDALDDPIYLIDGERRLRFVNRACAAWAGFPAETLIGCTVSYDSGLAETAADDLEPNDQEIRGAAEQEHARTDAKPRISGENNTPALAANGLSPAVFALHVSTEQASDNATAIAPTSPGIVYARDPVGRLRRRQAQYIPLTVDGELDLVLVRLTTVDFEEVPDDPSSVAAVNCQSLRIEAYRLHDELMQFRAAQSARFRLDRLVGTSPAIQRVRAQIKLAAAGRSQTWIFGPPGSGKQLVATMIHRATDDAPPLMLIDCAALDSDAIRSLLSASVAKSRSRKVTLLLRDFQLATADAQVDLERLLEQPANEICILATSTQSIEQLSSENALRPRLAAMLGTLEIELPALASRRQDIPLIAQSLLEAINLQGAKQLRGFAVDCLDRMVRHAWSNNIDELAACVREAHAHAEGIEITTTDLPKRMHYAADAAGRPARPADEPIELESLLASIEKELIRKALKRAKGNKAGAARLLSLTRPRLYRRMEQLGMIGFDAIETDTLPPNAATHSARVGGDEPPEFIEDLPFEEEPA